MVNIDEVNKLSPSLQEIVENEINVLLKVKALGFFNSLSTNLLASSIISYR